MSDMEEYFGGFTYGLIFRHYYLILVVLFMYFGKGHFGYVDTAVSFGILAIPCVELVINLFDAWKYRTSQFVGDSFHASHLGPPLQCGEYDLFSLGDIGFLGMSSTEGWLVQRRNTTFLSGEEHYTPVQSEVVLSAERLPPDVREFVRAYRLKGPFRYGIATSANMEKLKVDGVETTYFLNRIKDLSLLNAEYVDIINNKFGGIHNFVSHASNAVHSLDKGPSVVERAKQLIHPAGSGQGQ